MQYFEDINLEDVEEFVHWAFEELQVDSINLRRVAVEAFHPRSYLADSVIAERSLGLSDEEWHIISRKIFKKRSKPLNRS